ncbi:hypothetical protein SLA2020_003440 [Shorea laevis]
MNVTMNVGEEKEVPWENEYIEEARKLTVVGGGRRFLPAFLRSDLCVLGDSSEISVPRLILWASGVGGVYL